METEIDLSWKEQAILSEIKEHLSEPFYWEVRFSRLPSHERQLLQECFMELQRKNLIDTMWQDDFPIVLSISSKESKDKSTPSTTPSFSTELIDLIIRGRKLYIPRTEIPSNLYDLLFQRQVWLNDMEIFYNHYLANHILSNKIFNILHSETDKDKIQSLIPCLVSISKDNRFIESIETPPREKHMVLSSFEYDVFISHANSDKIAIVDEMNESLEKLGIRIFYDKKTLEWGDHWKSRILEGTQKAEFAIIVISENFFDREWTEKELNEFLNRQNSNGQKLILPILHNITITQLQEKYPSVADIQGISTKDYTCDQIALLFARQLIKRLRPTHIQ